MIQALPEANSEPWLSVSFSGFQVLGLVGFVGFGARVSGMHRVSGVYGLEFWVARCVMGHYHVGAFALPWDIDEWGWNAPSAGTISLEIIYCGIVESYPRRDKVQC